MLMAEVFALYEPFFFFAQFPSLFFDCARNSVQFSLMAEYFIGCLQLESLFFYKLVLNLDMLGLHHGLGEVIQEVIIIL
jgi:hypothetical protein